LAAQGGVQFHCRSRRTRLIFEVRTESILVNTFAMGEMADIIRLEVDLIQSAMLTRKEELENRLHLASGLTHEQWVKHYAEKFRTQVEAVLKKKGRLPTKEELERTLYHN
jgi:hypothetical protein